MIEIITEKSRYEVATESGKKMLYKDGHLLGRVYCLDLKKIRVGSSGSIDYYKGDDLWTVTTGTILEVRTA